MEFRDLALLGIVVVVLIVCIALFIFAPRSINYIHHDHLPAIKHISDNYIDVFKHDLETITDPCQSPLDFRWLLWPDRENVRGEVMVYPIYMFSTLSDDRKNRCYGTYAQIKKLENVKSCAFIKFGAKSKIIKSQQWSDLANTTIRALFILDAGFAMTDEQLGIWVNGEIKKISTNKLIMFDSSKEHTIYNETNLPFYALLVDVERPKDVPKGVSTREYTDELQDFVSRL